MTGIEILGIGIQVLSLLSIWAMFWKVMQDKPRRRRRDTGGLATKPRANRGLGPQGGQALTQQ